MAAKLNIDEDKTAFMRADPFLDDHEGSSMRADLSFERRKTCFTRADRFIDPHKTAFIRADRSIDAHETSSMRVELSLDRSKTALMPADRARVGHERPLMQDRSSDVGIKPAAVREDLVMVRTDPSEVCEEASEERINRSGDAWRVVFMVTFVSRRGRDPLSSHTTRRPGATCCVTRGEVGLEEHCSDPAPGRLALSPHLSGSEASFFAVEAPFCD